MLDANSFPSYVTASTKGRGGYTDKPSSNGGDDFRKLKNTDLVLPSPCAIQTVYAVFILVLFSTLSLPVSHMSMSANDNCKPSCGRKNCEM